MVTEHCRVNVCSYTRGFLSTHILPVYQSVINQQVCITDNYLRLKSAYFRWGTRELAKSHIPSICTEIYFVCQLNRNAGDLILRIYFHRRITENSDVKATVHSYLRMNMTTEMTCFYIQLLKNASEM